MISIKKILNEVLNNFSVEIDLVIDPSFNTYDILNEIRALKRVTIVTVITPDVVSIQGIKTMKYREGTLKRMD